MRIVLTGSSGRVGRAIFGALAADHEVIGIDRTAFSTTHFVDEFTNESLLREVLQGSRSRAIDNQFRLIALQQETQVTSGGSAGRVAEYSIDAR